MAGFWNSVKNAVLGSVTQYDALPNGDSININPAYILEVRISGENGIGSGYKAPTFKNRPYNGITIIRAYCPEVLSLNFTNDYGTINPMDLSSSKFVNGVVQLFSGTSTTHRINNIQVWQGSKPLTLKLKLELYASRSNTTNNIKTGDTTLTSGGLSSNDLLYIIEQLSSLAQPRIDDKSGRLIPPGPSPLVTNFNGHVFKVEKDKSGKVKNVTIKKDSKGNLVKGKQKTRVGTRVDVSFGNFFTMSHVIVKDVNVDIPYIMAGSDKYVGPKTNIHSVANTLRAKPVMATVTMTIQTKTMVDQEMFKKMINNQEQPNPAEIDLTKMDEGLLKSVLSGILALGSDYVDASNIEVVEAADESKAGK